MDRETMRTTDEFVYQVLPAFDAEELIERDFDRVVDELYNLPFEEVLDFLGRISSALSSCPELLERYSKCFGGQRPLQTCILISPLPVSGIC